MLAADGVVLASSTRYAPPATCSIWPCDSNHSPRVTASYGRLFSASSLIAR